MLWFGTNNTHDSIPTNYLAMSAKLLNRRSYFHFKILSLLLNLFIPWVVIHLVLLHTGFTLSINGQTIQDHLQRFLLSWPSSSRMNTLVTLSVFELVQQNPSLQLR